MKILILGASGQIGSYLARGLADNHQVKGTSRSGRAGTVQFDPFADSWIHLGQFDVVINCIGQIAATSENSFEKIHVGLTRLILDNASLLGNPRILQISALGAASGHPVEFLRTKGIADEMLLGHANVAVLRPSIVCTPGTMLIQKMHLLNRLASLAFGRIIVPKGFLQTQIQPVMPQDILNAVEKLLSAQSQRTLNLVGPETISFQEMLDIMSENQKREFRTVEMPRKLADYLILRIAARVTPNLINSQQYQLLFTDNIADAAPLSKLLGRPLQGTKDFFMRELNRRR